VPSSAADTREPEFDPDRIVATLARHDVTYLLVGGMGARHYGATRFTEDLDCLAQFNNQNLGRLADAMRELNARLRVEGMTDAESLTLTRHLPSVEFFRRGELSTWMTDAGKFDVLHDMPARDGERLVYEQLVTRADVHEYPGGLTVSVAALADIVASKEWADRPKDHLALPELYAIQERGDDGPAADGGVPVDPAPGLGRGGPTGRTLANGLDRPIGSSKLPPERDIGR